MNRNSIAINREYVKGLNTQTGSAMHSLNGLKAGLVGLLGNEAIPKHNLLPLLRSVGELERLHAPHEIGETTNAEGWIGSACCKTGDQWEQWIQIASIPRSTIRIHAMETETFEAQTIMVGSDRKRVHIEWGVGRKEGYIHSATSRYMDTDEFLETTPAPPNCLLALPAGEDAMYGFTLQTGDMLKGTDDSFRWYDTDGTMKWYRFMVYILDGQTHVAVVDAKHLRDALSGFDEHRVSYSEARYSMALSDNDKDAAIEEDTSELYILKGSIRIDGSFEGRKRTAVLMTARLDDETIEQVMGVDR